MSKFTAILRGLTADQFATMLAASPRQAKEVYFQRHAIKAPKTRGVVRPGEKNARRGAALLAALQAHEDEEVAQEILRGWLLARRALLAAALDHLEIPHQDGLSDSEEVSKIGQLPPPRQAALREVLLAQAPAWEVDAYLEFLKAA